MAVDPRYQVLKPFRPVDQRGWERWDIESPELLARAYAIERWYNRAHEVQVLSAIEQVGGNGPTPRVEYHVSVTGVKHLGKVYRCSDSTARWVLKQFDFADCHEDNHVPGGKARNWWRPIAENENPACHCEETEPKIVEDKGDYVWRHAPDK